MADKRVQRKKIIAENIITLDNEYVNSDLILAVQDTDYNIDEFETYKNKIQTTSKNRAVFALFSEKTLFLQK